MVSVRIFHTGLIFLVSGFVAGFVFAYYILPQHTRGFQIRQKGYTYISPILGFELATDSKEFEEFLPIKRTISDAATQAKKNTDIQSISVYFRALNSGRWVGYEEDKDYDGASLLKIAAVVAFYKAAESNPDLLTRRFVWNGGSSSDVVRQNIDPPPQLVAGQAYSGSALAERALRYSDNEAVTLLSSALTDKNVTEIATDLGIPVKNGTIGSISPKSYSFLFRILYNASYLSRDASERILEILAESDFRKGLVKGVPTNLRVANKFGERTFSDLSHQRVGSIEFHDCGIIYYPDHPYFLCVMTRGNSFAAQIGAIASLSEAVYISFEKYWKTHTS